MPCESAVLHNTPRFECHWFNKAAIAWFLAHKQGGTAVIECVKLHHLTVVVEMDAVHSVQLREGSIVLDRMEHA